MTSRNFVIKAIQDEYQRETGERPTNRTADVLLDRRCAAFHEKLEGAGPVYAVREDRLLTDWLKNLWVGENNGVAGKKLRDGCIVVDAQVEVHGTWPLLSPESQATLKEQIAELTGEGAEDAAVELQAKAWKKMLVAVRKAATEQPAAIDPPARSEELPSTVQDDTVIAVSEPQVGWVVDGVVHTAPAEVPAPEQETEHDFCIENRRSSTRLHCKCGSTSRFSRDDSKTHDSVDAHKAAVSQLVSA